VNVETNGVSLNDRAATSSERIPFEDCWTRASGEWISKPPPAQSFLMTDVRTGRGAMSKRGVYLLVAEGGAGKSFFTLSMLLSVAAGELLFGVFQPARADGGHVLYLSAEESREDVHRRIFFAARTAGIVGLKQSSFDVLDIHDRCCPLLQKNGSLSMHHQNLLKFIERHGPYDLVVVDPLARVAGADIDADNGAATALISALEGVSTVAEGLVVSPHHTDKIARRNGIKDATAVRGATGIGDGARMVMGLSVDKLDFVTLDCRKVNGLRKWAPVDLMRGDNGELFAASPEVRQAVEAARKEADPKRQARVRQDAERAQRKADEVRREEEARTARAASREDATRVRDEADDVAARKLRAERPGDSDRVLQPILRKILACGGSRAWNALVRTRPAPPSTSPTDTQAQPQVGTA
jgi:AAA domain